MKLIFQVPLVLGDYQLELNLIYYGNPQRRLANGECCDLRDPTNPQANCLANDDCDVRFSFSVQNTSTLFVVNRQDIAVGTYENTATITFPNCANLINNRRNPLRFEIPTNQWRVGVSETLLMMQLNTV